MKVILIQDVKNLGQKGALVEVAEGYGRNFLLPRGLAMEASQGAVKSLEAEKERQQQKAARLTAQAKAAAAKLNGMTVTVKARVGEGTRLFGSVTAKDVAGALQKVTKIEIDKRKVEIKEPIKSLGTYPATIKLHPEASAEIKVSVEQE